MANIFEEYVKESKIFKFKDALSPHYIPDELPGRQKECEQFKEIFSAALRGEKVSNVLVYGNPGTGKTCVIRYMKRELEEIAKKKNIKNVIFIYINCKINANTEYRVIRKILEDENFLKFNEDTGKKIYDEKKLDGLPIDKFYSFLEYIVRKNNLNLIVALDEIDIIKRGTDKDNLMYKIERINGNLFNEKTGKFDGYISIVGITNDATFKNKLDSRTRSTLAEKCIVFEKYETPHLIEILEQRKNIAFHDGVVKDAAIRFAAAYAVNKYDGDARYALNLLKSAGEIAEKENKNFIGEEEIKKACGDAEIDILEEIVKQLSDHQKIALYAIADGIVSKRYNKSRLFQENQHDAILSGEAYDSYIKKCSEFGEKPRTMRWFREYINDLHKNELISIKEPERGRGNTTIIYIGKYYSPEEINKTIKKVIDQMYKDEDKD
ncbi:MAG: Cdc6/Cdc18 family protein [Candidatus Altarchaeaceae archaeon]